MLEYAKGTNPQISLLLMKLYGFVGATEFITDIYDGLYIKHLQTATLGYALSPRPLPSPFPSTSSSPID